MKISVFSIFSMILCVSLSSEAQQMGATKNTEQLGDAQRCYNKAVASFGSESPSMFQKIKIRKDCMFNRAMTNYENYAVPNKSAPEVLSDGTVRFRSFYDQGSKLYEVLCGSSGCQRLSERELCAPREDHVGGGRCVCKEGYYRDSVGMGSVGACLEETFNNNYEEEEATVCDNGRPCESYTENGVKFNCSPEVSQFTGALSCTWTQEEAAPAVITCQDNPDQEGCEREAVREAVEESKNDELEGFVKACQNVINSSRADCSATESRIQSQADVFKSKVSESNQIKDKVCTVDQELVTVIDKAQDSLNVCKTLHQECLAACGTKGDHNIGLQSECSKLSIQASNAESLISSLQTTKAEAQSSCQKLSASSDQEADDSPATKDRWGALSKNTFGALDSFSSQSKTTGLSSSAELGSGGGRIGAASTSGYSAGGGSYGPSGSLDGGGLSGLPGIGGGSDSPGGNSNKQTNTPFPTAGSNNTNGRVNSVAGPNRTGGGSGLSFSNEDTNFKVKDENGKRVYTNAKERNLVLGFKKAKVGGGGFATYSPDDFKKFGKTKMKQKLKEARETYGDHTPLLFQDGRFVRDLLQMKENLAWKRHNQRQKRRLSGLSDVDKKDQVQEVFHECVRFEECYTEERYNIFKLHHFKARKLLKPEI